MSRGAGKAVGSFWDAAKDRDSSRSEQWFSFAAPHHAPCPTSRWSPPQTPARCPRSAPAPSPHAEAGASLSPQPSCPHCGRTHGSDPPGPLPVLPCSCWHEALTQHSSPESPVPAQANFQALRAGAP